MNTFWKNLKIVFVLALVFTRVVSIGYSQSDLTESLIITSASLEQVSNLSVASTASISDRSTVGTSIDSDSDLWKLCPVDKWAEEYDGNHPEISKECIVEMGKHLQKHPRLLGNNWLTQLILLENRMTYDRIFEDPDGDRARVIDSLSRSECQFQEGELVRWDLKDSCHADAFANYANYLSTCHPRSYLSTWLEHNEEWKESLEHSPDSSDPWNNTEVRKIVFQLNVESHWVRDHCKSSRTENHILHDENEDLELFQLLNVVASNIGERPVGGSGRYLRGDAIKVLVAIAAKLGDEWASLEYRGNIHLHPNPWHDKIEKLQPWRRQQYLQYWNKPPTVQRVRDAINLVHTLEDANRRVNWENFVANLCYYHTSDQRKHKCQQSIESLRQKELDPLDNERVIKTLSHIEQTARKLGIYSNPNYLGQDLRYLYEKSSIFRVLTD